MVVVVVVVNHLPLIAFTYLKFHFSADKGSEIVEPSTKTVWIVEFLKIQTKVKLKFKRENISSYFMQQVLKIGNYR